MKNKAKGYRREYQARKLLEKTDFDVVRAGGSIGIFDLIAWNRKQIRFIQVKSNWCSPQEREAIREYKNCPPNSTKEIWIYKNGDRNNPNIGIIL